MTAGQKPQLGDKWNVQYGTGYLPGTVVAVRDDEYDVKTENGITTFDLPVLKGVKA